MWKTILILLAIAFLGLAGCAGMGSTVTPQETAAKYGPLPENWQALVVNCIERSLIDPESATYSWHVPQSKSNGWYGGVFVNAKNRFGGYTGKKPFEWLIENGEVTVCREHVLSGAAGY